MADRGCHQEVLRSHRVSHLSRLHRNEERGGRREVQAVTNVGVRPTFTAAPAPLVETHLLDYEANLYQEEISLSFIARLRDEQRFSGVPALVAQIQKDIHCAREILGARA